ncbi:MAG: hypothetical protein A2666_04885 [Parcubacteria group bacterium RIFCSPHIGHO2_01_FULL_47_10b]|nr:MAG: hypothetical protein A2666_04885 [Parcubacteria group bacterium RIFCSPHIGHO2_01_FULL_47_10b]
MKTPKFRDNLFWDIDIKKADFKKQAYFIVGRVLDFGEVRDFQTLKQLYDIQLIRSAARHHPFFSERSIHFWSIILNIPKRQLSCIRKRSRQQPSAFSLRSEKVA